MPGAQCCWLSLLHRSQGGLTLCAGCHRNFAVNVTDSSTNSHVRQGQCPCLESQAGALLRSGPYWRRLCGRASDKERCWRGCAFSQAALMPWVHVYCETCGFGVNLTDTQAVFLDSDDNRTDQNCSSNTHLRRFCLCEAGGWEWLAFQSLALCCVAQWVIFFTEK